MPQLQTILVILIVAGAAFYLVRRFYNSLKKSDSSACGCGCSGCDIARSCEDFDSRQD
jgi:hypothetical protein